MTTKCTQSEAFVSHRITLNSKLLVGGMSKLDGKEIPVANGNKAMKTVNFE